MARVIIYKKLKDEIIKKFCGESKKVFKLMKSLEKNHSKGKLISNIGKILIKEIKYKSFRFYFLVENLKIKILSETEIKGLLIKFVRMSDKKSQQKIIDQIKNVLRELN